MIRKDINMVFAEYSKLYNNFRHIVVTALKASYKDRVKITGLARNTEKFRVLQMNKFRFIDSMR